MSQTSKGERLLFALQVRQILTTGSASMHTETPNVWREVKFLVLFVHPKKYILKS